MGFFHHKFKDYSEQQLRELVENPDEYQKEAVAAATDLLLDKGHELTKEQLKVKIEYDLDEENKRFQHDRPLGRSRLLALSIDVVILGLSSYLIGYGLLKLSITNQYVFMVVDAILLIGYFSLGNSELFEGATVGKRQSNLKVVDEAHNCLPLKKSISRSLLFLVPIFIVQILEKIDHNSIFLEVLAFILRFSFYGALVFFFIADKKWHRLYYDLVLRTMVTRNNKPDVYPEYPQRNYVFFAMLVAIIFAGGIAMSYANVLGSVAAEERLTDFQNTIEKNYDVLTEIVREVEEIEEVERANGIKISTINYSQTNLIVDVQLNFNPNNKGGDRIANLILSKIDGKNIQVKQLDNVEVILRYGFKMTLASYYSHKTKIYGVP